MKNAAVVSGNVLARKCIFLQCMIFQTHINCILGKPGVTKSVPTAFIIDECSGYRMGHTNAVGTELVTQMQWVQNGSHKCSGYRMGHTNAVGTEWVTQMQWVQNGSHKCSGYGMGHTNAAGTEWVTQMQWIGNGSHKCSGYRMGHTNAVGREWVTPGYPRMH